MMADSEARTRQVDRLQAELARVEAERDDAYAKLRLAGVKARGLRQDAQVWRDMVEGLSEGLATLQKRAAQPDGDPADVLARLSEDAGRVLHTTMLHTAAEVLSEDGDDAVSDAKDQQ